MNTRRSNEQMSKIVDSKCFLPALPEIPWAICFPNAPLSILVVNPNLVALTFYKRSCVKAKTEQERDKRQRKHRLG
jgi:hypothetical protein